MACRRDTIIQKYYPYGELLIAIWMDDCVICPYCKATHYGSTFPIEEQRNKTIFWTGEEISDEEKAIVS